MSEQSKCLRRARVMIPSLDLDSVNDSKHVLDFIYVLLMLQLNITVVASSNPCPQRLPISFFHKIHCDVFLYSFTLGPKMIYNFEVLHLDCCFCLIFWPLLSQFVNLVSVDCHTISYRTKELVKSLLRYHRLILLTITVWTNLPKDMASAKDHSKSCFIFVH